MQRACFVDRLSSSIKFEYLQIIIVRFIPEIKIEITT